MLDKLQKLDDELLDNVIGGVDNLQGVKRIKCTKCSKSFSVPNVPGSKVKCPHCQTQVTMK